MQISSNSTSNSNSSLIIITSFWKFWRSTKYLFRLKLCWLKENNFKTINWWSLKCVINDGIDHVWAITLVCSVCRRGKCNQFSSINTFWNVNFSISIRGVGWAGIRLDSWTVADLSLDAAPRESGGCLADFNRTLFKEYHLHQLIVSSVPSFMKKDFTVYFLLKIIWC